MSAVIEAVPDKAQLKKYKLSLVQRIPMILWTVVCVISATAIGSAIYFLVTQVSWQTRYGNKTTIIMYNKDLWDRLPVHIDNWLHVTWFGTSQVAPEWWYNARHDVRHVIIVVIAALLIGAITIPIKPRKRASGLKMALSVPLAFIVALATAGVMIVLMNYVTPFLAHWGTTTNNPLVSNYLGKGTLQLTVIGIVSGIAAKAVLKPTFDTLQLMSLEGKLAQGDVEQWWWKFVYPPNYVNRFRYLKDCGHEVKRHNPVIGFFLTFGSPVFVFLLGVGIWLLYIGPAKHAK